MRDMDSAPFCDSYNDRRSLCRARSGPSRASACQSSSAGRLRALLRSEARARIQPAGAGGARRRRGRARARHLKRAGDARGEALECERAIARLAAGVLGDRAYDGAAAGRDRVPSGLAERRRDGDVEARLDPRGGRIGVLAPGPDERLARTISSWSGIERSGLIHSRSAIVTLESHLYQPTSL